MRVPLWQPALVLALFAAALVVLPLVVVERRPTGPLVRALPDILKPVVVAETAVAVETPFDSHPWARFVPTRAWETRLARYPLEEAHEQAALLDLSFPSSLRWVECEGALLHNRLWQDGYIVNVTCGHPRPAAGSGVPVVDRDLAVGYDPAHITFQHDMITGISHAAFFLDWALGAPGRRGVLCHKVVCEVLRAATGSTEVPQERGLLPKLFWAPSLRYNRAPNDTAMDGCEPFPLGSFWPVEVFLRQVRRRGKLKPPRSDAPTILYLSRGTKSNSIRWLDNEEELVTHLRAFARSRGWRVEVMPHETVAVSAATTSARTISSFFHAAAVVGLHGGAFSNIVFCHRRAVVLEINNNVKARECFSGISVSRGLQYVRFQPQREFWYQSWDHFALHPREMRQITALLEHHIKARYVPIPSISDEKVE